MSVTLTAAVFVCSICQLYNWRYKKLGNLPHVSLWPEYRAANAGFFFDFQLINVDNFNGVGESEPNPYFYQVCLHFISRVPSSPSSSAS